jgi:hypothetical protein
VVPRRGFADLEIVREVLAKVTASLGQIWRGKDLDSAEILGLSLPAEGRGPTFESCRVRQSSPPGFLLHKTSRSKDEQKRAGRATQ